MPLFRRSGKSSPEIAVVPGPIGDAPCQNGGCPNHTGVVCSYLDRRGRHCTTTWCPDHYRLVGGLAYCPRHAGIMTALSLSPQKGHLPELDNRAPSLANWVGTDLDGGIRDLLRQVIKAADGETIIVEPVGYVYTVHDHTHRWERAWKLANHTGVTLKISVDVDETNDSLVRIRVGQQTITRVVPPWVERNSRHQHVEAQTDVRERSDFYGALLRQIADAVGQQRQVAMQRPYIGSDPDQGTYTPR